HYGLAQALDTQDKLDEAGAQYQQALAIKPDLAEAHNGLGAILAAQGYFEAQFNFANALARQQQWAAALEHYSEALRLRPDFADAHGNIGVALDHLGRTKEAIEHYRLALQANSNAPIPLKKLAWILATSPDPTLRDATEAL